MVQTLETDRQSLEKKPAKAKVQKPSLSVIIPVYNEILSIGELLRRVVAAAPLDKEIIVVDDSSTDGTRDFLTVLKERPELVATPGIALPPIEVIFQPINQGKGAAIREGIRHASGTVSVI